MKWLRENAAAIMAIMAILTPLLLYASSIDGRLDSIEKDVFSHKEGSFSVERRFFGVKKGSFSH